LGPSQRAIVPVPARTYRSTIAMLLAPWFGPRTVADLAGPPIAASPRTPALAVRVRRGTGIRPRAARAHRYRLGADVWRGEVRERPMAVELAEMISQLRAELTTAMREGADSELRFEVGPVELELTVVVEKEATPGAKVRFWVVELGADARAASSTTQHIRLTLDPRQPGRPGQRAQIAGTAVPDER
jgi:Trypsin-co-occurring domain 2